MPSPDDTHFPLPRMHVLFALAALVLLAATLGVLGRDHAREWKEYQRTYRDQVEPRLAALRQAERGDAPRPPQADVPRRPLAVQQVWLPDLTIDYHFRQVARFDRCTTCHAGMDQTGGDSLETQLRGQLPQPYGSHPRPDLYCGPTSPHPLGAFGCTVCHDGQGSATAFHWASHSPDTPADGRRWQAQHDWSRNPHWDYPMLPGRFAESRCLRCHPNPLELEASKRFPDPPAEKLLAGYRLVRTHGCFGCHEINGSDGTGRRVGPDLRLETAAGAAQGLRKVGPSLREVAPRLSRAVLTHWIRDPASLLPTTRMPQFYGLHAHLSGQALADAQRFEAVELQAMAEYLVAASHPVALASRLQRQQTPSAERGRQLLATQGCLACHRHVAFPEIAATQGPALDRLAAKFDSAGGQAWLESWIRDPLRHAPRTRMPRVDMESSQAPAGTDPVADVVAFLRTPTDWHPAPAPAFQPADLDDLLRKYLCQQCDAREAERLLAEGAGPGSTGLPADVALLAAPLTREKKLRYVGLRTLRGRGCAGCHDIPGLEDAQPIGPALTDWGRKQESLLAFGRVQEFIESVGASGEDPSGFYGEAIRQQRREGFLWQKLHAPRSFDYQAARDKEYTSRLKMGQMRLTDRETEEVATFILGLVAQPPAASYVYTPDPRARAIAAGREVLEQNACPECHTLQLERWKLAVDPKQLEEPPPMEEHPFLQPRFARAEVAASQKTDRHGRLTAELVGMPRVDAQGAVQEDTDDDDHPLYFFQLWEPALLGGRVWPAGGADLAVSGPWIVAKRGPWGGAFTRWLYPQAVAASRASGFASTELEAWGWVPPPLVREGGRVRPQWLYQFLLTPQPIRPASVLRMPQFSLSPKESRALVEYFLAMAGRESAFSEGEPGLGAQALRDTAVARQLDAAMKMLTDRKTFCAKCHLIGDYSPGGEVRTTLAPNLAQAAQRFEPAALRQWLANPRTVFPYTAMPVNFPPGEPLGQDLFPADSVTQLDAVARLLLNYSWYWESRTSIDALIRQGSE